MATKKQIAANRRNAKKSTGPRTVAGKVKSAQNATKHGLRATQPLLPEEDGAAYEAWRMSLIHELWPETPLERAIVERLAGVQWRLMRVPGIEAELLGRLRVNALGRDEGLGGAWARDVGPHGGALARLSRYETALERSAARLLAELRRLQDARRKAERAETAREQAAEQADWWQRAAAAWPGAPAITVGRPGAPVPTAGRTAPGTVSPSLGGGRGEAPAQLPNEASCPRTPGS